MGLPFQFTNHFCISQSVFVCLFVYLCACSCFCLNIRCCFSYRLLKSSENQTVHWRFGTAQVWIKFQCFSSCLESAQSTEEYLWILPCLQCSFCANYMYCNSQCLALSVCIPSKSHINILPTTTRVKIKFTSHEWSVWRNDFVKFTALTDSLM